MSALAAYEHGSLSAAELVRLCVGAMTERPWTWPEAVEAALRGDYYGLIVHGLDYDWDLGDRMTIRRGARSVEVDVRDKPGMRAALEQLSARMP